MVDSETETSSSNTVAAIAEEFIRDTSRCIFLTGKAGTGKTTFLKHIRDTTTKTTVVAAPTGVAAIHAGGVTLHSFFQLPFSPFVPVAGQGGQGLIDRYNLLKESKIDGEKKALLRSLELLIIDEISMVRCDILDAIDTILRYYRGKERLPFGGVQVLFIGDLFQLPPVMPDNDWRLLNEYYASPFFFDARVIHECKPVYLELKKIYRQQDPVFIELLNGVRNNITGGEHLTMLNERYMPEFNPDKVEKYVTLTTHNQKADAINARELDALSGHAMIYEGVIEGDFQDRSFPTDRILKLKVGAQVMFIKNDMERIRRYYNGKIGTVTALDDEKIIVQCSEDEPEIEVTRDMWRNVRYSLNRDTRQIEEEQLGTFTQYALRLAWAVTIHKSQGLTLDKVIIDAGQSFAPGQVYVALSRCTSLSGIVLHSKIFKSSIQTDPRVIAFAAQERSPEELQPVLASSRLDHIVQALISVFDLNFIRLEVEDFIKKAEKRKTINKEELSDITSDILAALDGKQQVAEKFHNQLTELSRLGRYEQIKERVEAAVTYFDNFLADDVVDTLAQYKESVKNGRKKQRGYLKNLSELLQFVVAYQGVLQKGLQLTNQLTLK
jgi:hypothetical protein